MGDSRSDPSMEDILASIKRIIADDSQATAPAVSRMEVEAGGNAEPLRFTPPPLHLIEPADERADDIADAEPKEEVLELTQPVEHSEPPRTEPVADETLELGPAAASAAAAAAVRQPRAAEPIVSEDAATASRQSLAALSALLVKPEEESPSNTLEGLVREMLRPMMKEWLDQRLPDLVERLVEREIARITGRPL